MAQFQSEIELRVKVLDKELADLEKRIAKVANPFSASGARKGQSKAELSAQRQLLSVDRNRLQLAQQLNVERVKTTNLNTSWYKALQQGKQIQADINKAVAKEAELRAKTAAASRKAVTQRIGSGLASGAIGGAFPLLFGQGGAGAIGGALGGLGGGLIGGQFGFALSLVGSAIGDAVQKSDELNKSIAGLNASFDTATTTVSLTRDQISDLAKDLSLANDEAVTLLGSFSAFTGPQAVELARGFSEVGGVDTAQAIAKARLGEKETLEAINSLRSVIGNEEAESLLKTLEIKGAQAASAALLDALLQKQKDITTETQSTVTFWDQIQSRVASITAALSGIGDPASVPTAQDIADDRADALPGADKGVIDTALGNLERFYKESARLEELYKPKRGGRKGTNDEERIQQRLAILNAETAAIQRRAEIESKISQARIAEDQSLVNRLTLERELSTIREREEKAAARVTDLRLKQAIAEKAAAEAAAARSRFADKEAERIAKAEKSFSTQMRTLELQLEASQAITREERQQAELQLQLFKLREANKDLTEEQLKKLEEMTKKLFEANNLSPIEGYIKKSQEQLADTESMILSLAQSVEGAMANAIGGAVESLVTGAQTIEQTLADMFKAIGKAFIQMAAEIIAKQLVMIALQSILKALGASTPSKGSTGVPGLEKNSYYGTGGRYGSFTPPKLADGGFVTRPTNAMVGEGGESEYVIPESKMSSAMQRYNAGTRGEAVVDGANAIGGSGGSLGAEAPPTINIEGGVMQFNDSNYIRQDQVPAIVSQASKQGEARALRRLQMSPSARRKAGVR